MRVQRMGSAGVGVGLVAAGICPMHGPIVKTSVAELVRKYRRGSASRRPGHCSVGRPRAAWKTLPVRVIQHEMGHGMRVFSAARVWLHNWLFLALRVQ